MSRLRALAAWPLKVLIDPIEKLVKRKLAGLIDDRLEAVRGDLRTLNAKMDTILDINIAPDVLRDFRTHNETLRAIRADCDLIREMNPMFNSVLRDLMRLQLACEELSWRLDAREDAERVPELAEASSGP